ncbi:putative SKP1 component, dimerization, SKP1-like, dimerization domain superfamily [Helianthus annuus]|uniref:SKP1 component, dimerization, SKP1-like, dimerization domain superfamily n=1 Tax=Helianthus annuus TaxID=4232 RepID=A0A9K3NV43_HELAN|nr:putative SKP1 component, dimerization, SKP1-like, dimerization domain superfamily [Helianthus annuus]KAJ0599213.1 putative SKP1 component, dimerization, SKP1-like, dimerization domain superfamily [Helianthus annuus]KAJ0606843.1 putative SKP1/BTB/POZ domain superfamily, SKP1 component, dimerization [Helianthus annuus]KAJ0772761.1 putative SKP1/BTB/POZ domain superfamily, SKP1 component, dimerization [Helianthus annuus]KAJ0934209.1 putative SKP1 component, dimerization, SKP1-like, dimerization
MDINSLLTKECDETSSSHRVTSSLKLPNWLDDFLTKTVYHTMAEVNETDQTPTVDPKTPNLGDSTTSSQPKPKQITTMNVAVPIPDVGPQLQVVVEEFILKSGSDDEEVRTAARNDLRDFIEREEIGITTLLVVVKYAHEVKSADLLDAFCERVADLIKDKKVVEVRQIFGIVNDFTPEEEQALRDEHPWAFED